MHNSKAKTGNLVNISVCEVVDTVTRVVYNRVKFVEQGVSTIVSITDSASHAALLDSQGINSSYQIAMCVWLLIIGISCWEMHAGWGGRRLSDHLRHYWALWRPRTSSTLVPMQSTRSHWQWLPAITLVKPLERCHKALYPRMQIANVPCLTFILHQAGLTILECKIMLIVTMYAHCHYPIVVH